MTDLAVGGGKINQNRGVRPDVFLVIARGDFFYLGAFLSFEFELVVVRGRFSNHIGNVF